MKYLILLLLIILSNSCLRPKPIKDAINLNDFDMVSTPNETDKVGLIFAVDRYRKQYKITNIDIPVTSGNIRIPSYTNNRTMTWKVLGNFLQANSNNLTVSATLKDSLIKNIDFSLEDPVQNVSYLMDINNILEKKKEDIRNYLKKSPELEKAKFYLIIETIMAKSLKYNLKNQVAADNNLGVNISKIASANPNLSWNTGENYNLEYKFSSPLVVFYKTYKLEVQNSLVGEYDITLIKDTSVGNDGMKYTSK